MTNFELTQTIRRDDIGCIFNIKETTTILNNSDYHKTTFGVTGFKEGKQICSKSFSSLDHAKSFISKIKEKDLD